MRELSCNRMCSCAAHRPGSRLRATPPLRHRHVKRADVKNFIAHMARQYSLQETRAAQTARERAEPARHPRGDGSARREGQALVRVSPDIRQRAAHPRGHGILGRAPPGTRSSQHQQRRRAGIPRGHPRRRDLLRPPHRHLPRARRAGDAGLRLPAARQVLPRRARAISAAHARLQDWIR